jgi:hypothetical protein
MRWVAAAAVVGVVALATGDDVSGGACAITCPANISVSNDPNQCGAVVNFSAPDAPSCTNVVCAPAAGSFFPVGVTTITCTTDEGPSCAFTTTVLDTQPPSITCPANITQDNAVNQCSAVVNFPPPQTSDNCPGVTVACVPASGSLFPVGTTTDTCTSTDAAGNTASCAFTNTVEDVQPPTVTCPDDQEAFSANAQPTSVVFPPPVASDNCPGVMATTAPASGSLFPIGITTATCQATDGAGNMDDGLFRVLVDFPVTAVPTLSTIGFLALVLALGALGLRMLR